MAQLEKIEKYKDMIINAIIVVVTLIIAVNIYNRSVTKVKFLQEKISEEEKKNAELDQLSRLVKKVEAYRKLLPRRESNVVMADIGNIAKDKVKVLTVRPDHEEKGADYTKEIFNVMVNAASYDELAKFINALETDSSVYLVDGMEIAAASGEMKKEELTVNLRITAVSTNQDQ